MKLSEMSTEFCADALLLIAPEIEPILLDGELMGALRKAEKSKDRAAAAGVRKLVALIPLLLGRYRENVFRILSALSGKTTADIAAQNILVTARQVREMMKDKELLDFFTLSAPSERSK